MVHDFTSAHTPGFIPSSEAAGEDSGSGVGRHTHAWQSCRRGARPACAALPVHTHPSCPLGTCVHKRVRHAGWACRRCTRVRWMYSTPFDWILSGVLSGAPLYRLCGCVRGGMEQRAPACCVHARVPPQHAGDGPSLYLLKHLCISTAA